MSVAKFGGFGCRKNFGFLLSVLIKFVALLVFERSVSLFIFDDVSINQLHSVGRLWNACNINMCSRILATAWQDTIFASLIMQVLPYWGNVKDRELLRRFWKPSTMYSNDGEFHVMVTPYSTFQTDEKYFNRIKWQYLILDEAQAIKNAQRYDIHNMNLLFCVTLK